MTKKQSNLAEGTLTKDSIWSDAVMTVDDVAQYLRIHKTTLYRLLKRNQIPAFRVGSDWRFSRKAIDSWMKEQRDPPGQ